MNSYKGKEISYFTIDNFSTEELVEIKDAMESKLACGAMIDIEMCTALDIIVEELNKRGE